MKLLFGLLISIIIIETGFANDAEEIKNGSARAAVKDFAQAHNFKSGFSATKKRFCVIESWDTKHVEPSLMEQVIPLMHSLKAMFECMQKDRLKDGEKAVSCWSRGATGKNMDVFIKKGSVVESRVNFNFGELSFFSTKIAVAGDTVTNLSEYISLSHKGETIFQYNLGPLGADAFLTGVQTIDELVSLLNKNELPVKIVYSAKSWNKEKGRGEYALLLALSLKEMKNRE